MELCLVVFIMNFGCGYFFLGDGKEEYYWLVVNYKYYGKGKEVFMFFSKIKLKDILVFFFS